MFSDKRIAKGCLLPTIIFFIFGMFFCFSEKLRILGFISIFLGFICVFFTIIFFISYQYKKFEAYYYCLGRNLKFYENCNKIIDEIGFSKIYKLRKQIDFHEGIGKETNGTVIKKYLHGIVSDGEGFKTLYFFLIEFENIQFPKFYFYTPNYFLILMVYILKQTEKILF